MLHIRSTSRRSLVRGADSIGLGADYSLVAPEADNLRAAIDWAAAASDFEVATSVAVALEQCWVTNNPHEGAWRLALLLEHDQELSPLLRGRAFRARGGTSFIAGNFEEGQRWHKAALAAFRGLDDAPRVAHMLVREAISAWHNGEALPGSGVAARFQPWCAAE